MKPIDPAGFEIKFQNDIDPWNYRSSPFEAYKQRVLLHACGSRTYGRGLEVGCAIGETSRMLAARCLRLVAVDSSITALAEARRRNADLHRIIFQQAILPEQMPHGPFDLIVMSEVAYYLTEQSLDILITQMTHALAPGGRIVCLHHTVRFLDAAQLPELAEERLKRRLCRSHAMCFRYRHARFEAVAFTKARR